MPFRRTPGEIIETLRDRQIALALCCGMSCAIVAEALEITDRAVAAARGRMLQRAGMNRFEFAVQMNAAVRERLWGESE